MKSESQVRKLKADLEIILRARLRGQNPEEVKEIKSVTILTASVSLLKFILDEPSDFDSETEKYIDIIIGEIKRRNPRRP